MKLFFCRITCLSIYLFLLLLSDNSFSQIRTYPVWCLPPYILNETTTSMAVRSLEFAGGTEYYFESVTPGGHNSGWQTDTTYIDTGLTPDKTYTYKVKARKAASITEETEFNYPQSIKVQKVAEPIIHTGMPKLGYNIDGPCLVTVPGWIPEADRADPSAKYYLYFANHGGDYIRMAWAANPMGPYTVYNPGAGVLSISIAQPYLDSLKFGYHIASPDVVIDSVRKKFVMYFHGDLKYNGSTVAGSEGQHTGVALSSDGLDFNQGVQETVISGFYLRVFKYKGELYGLDRYSILYKARDPEYPWKNPPPGQAPVNVVENGGLWEVISRRRNYDDNILNPFENYLVPPRHTALQVKGDKLEIFHSRSGTTPEHIECTVTDLSDNMYYLESSDPISILKPRFAWEGADIPLQTSGIGAATGVHELRDPYVFQDTDGTEYLLYSGRGEEAIGIVRLDEVYNREAGADPSIPRFVNVRSQQVMAGKVIRFSFSVVDKDAADKIKVYCDQFPETANLTETAPRNFEIVWQPEEKYLGFNTITLVASDGSNFSEVTFTIRVLENTNPGSAPELAQIGNKSIEENQTLNFTLSATDPDGDPLSFSSSKLPDGATLDGVTGAFAWTPTYAQSGSYLVTFIVSDQNLSDSETITINVSDRSSGNGPVASFVVNEPVTIKKTTTVLLSFDTYVEGLEISDFTLGNGTIDNISTLTEGFEYSITLTANDVGTVTIELSANSVTDAAGKGNAKATASYVFEDVINSSIPFSPDVSVYPNPAMNELFIDAQKRIKFHILNTLGTIVYSDQIDTSTCVNISWFLPGLYFIVIEEKNMRKVLKLIKE